MADDCSKSFILSSSSSIDGKVVAIHSHDCLLDSCFRHSSGLFIAEDSSSTTLDVQTYCS